jgi:hypothetical protein
MKDVYTVENTVKAGDFVERTKGTKAVTADKANVLVEEPIVICVLTTSTKDMEMTSQHLQRSQV